jgi:hypothetical protein
MELARRRRITRWRDRNGQTAQSGARPDTSMGAAVERGVEWSHHRNLFLQTRLAAGSGLICHCGGSGSLNGRTIMTEGLFALLLAGALMVPHVTPALGTESTVGIGGPRHAPPVLASGGALQTFSACPRRDEPPSLRARHGATHCISFGIRITRCLLLDMALSSKPSSTGPASVGSCGSKSGCLQPG